MDKNTGKEEMKVKGIMFSGFAAAILMGTVNAYAALEIEANTIRIGSVDDWNNFADSVKNGNTYSGKTVLLKPRQMHCRPTKTWQPLTRI